MEFGFQLKTQDKTFVLFTASLEEAKIWVRVLNLICEMNLRNIPVDDINPYDFEKFLKEVNKKPEEVKN